LPEKRGILITRRNDGILSKAKNRVKSNTEHANGAPIRIALRNGIDAIPILLCKDAAIVSYRDLLDDVLASTRWDFEVNGDSVRLRVICILKQLSEGDILRRIAS